MADKSICNLMEEFRPIIEWKKQTIIALSIFAVVLIALIAPLVPFTGVHVVIDENTTTHEYYIANFWIEDDRFPLIIMLLREDVSALHCLEIETIENVNGERISDKKVGLKCIRGEHVIEWDEPFPSDFLMIVELTEADVSLSREALRVKIAGIA